MDGRKVYIGDWVELLIKDLYINIDLNKKLAEKHNDNRFLEYAERDEKLLDKLDKYKKVTDKGLIYYYFFPNELEDFLWMLLENDLYEGVIKDEL